MADEELSEVIRDAAAGPAEVEADGVRVARQDPVKQVAVDRYLASKAAMEAGTGFRVTRLSSPGTT